MLTDNEKIKLTETFHENHKDQTSFEEIMRSLDEESRIFMMRMTAQESIQSLFSYSYLVECLHDRNPHDANRKTYDELNKFIAHCVNREWVEIIDPDELKGEKHDKR